MFRRTPTRDQLHMHGRVRASGPYGPALARYNRIAATLLLLALALLPAAGAAQDVAPVEEDPFVIVAFGDSLMAGYQLPPDKGFVPQLQDALDAKGYTDIEIQNAGISGDTTSGGLARLDWAVSPATDGVILELGANDGLRGIAPEIAEKNLSTIIETLQARNVPVLLVGMYAPPNMGADYGEAFNAIYPALAERYDVLFYPFFLEGVAADPSLNLGDGIHPNADGISVMVENILPDVEALIDKARAADNQ